VPSYPHGSLKLLVCTLLIAIFSASAGAQDIGVDSLAEAPAIQQLIRETRAQGNAEEAWNLEQGLLRLAFRHPDDLQSARILRDVGDIRLDIRARYNAEEFPPEIILGCYYNNSLQSADAERRGSQPIASAAVSDAGNNTCATGSRRIAARALNAEAQSLYFESARIVQRSEAVAGDELPEILMKLLASSYRNLNYGMGRWSLESLLTHQETISASGLSKAQTLALMGDWDLLFVPHLGKKYSESAAATYQEAIALLAGNEIGEEAINSIFSPQTPFLLPAFASNRLLSAQAANATGHIDVSFEIREDGRSARIKALDSSVNAPRTEQRELVNTIKNGRFRPIAENGQLVEAAPVTLRYYLND